jgi:phospholipid-binding lipoprotein MlaA
VVLIAALALGGCGTFSSALRANSAPMAASPLPVSAGAHAEADPEPAALLALREHGDAATEMVAVPALGVGDRGDDGANEPMIAQTPPAGPEKVQTESESDEDYDPWEKFNEVMFEVNRNLDRFVLKPVAQVYSVIVPEPFQILIANGFDNIAFVPRAVNSLLQGKWGGTGREVGRFLINSTAGIGGLFDAAQYWGIEKSREDFGQTLGVWGLGPGPYLVLPLLAPMTIRDGIGRGVDALMNPLTWVGPSIWIGLAMKAAEMINDRALNLELFQGLEESVIDLYSAVRNGYLRRREQMIKE